MRWFESSYSNIGDQNRCLNLWVDKRCCWGLKPLADWLPIKRYGLSHDNPWWHGKGRFVPNLPPAMVNLSNLANEWYQQWYQRKNQSVPNGKCWGSHRCQDTDMREDIIRGRKEGCAVWAATNATTSSYLIKGRCTLEKYEQLIPPQMEIVTSRRDAFRFSKENETSGDACLRYKRWLFTCLW